LNVPFYAQADLLGSCEQRLAAIYLLHALFPHEPATSHPFGLTLAAVAAGQMPGAVRRAERYLAAQLLAGHITKTASQSPRRWLSNENSYPAKPSAPTVATADKVAEPLSPRLADAVPALLGPAGQPTSSGSPTFAAPVLRPAPPLHPIGEHEVWGR